MGRMIREFQLTDSQYRALDRGRNIAVTASAGSGKTAILVERYLDTLVSGDAAGIGNVLAITFTQKAAAEMRQRVAQRVEKALEQEQDPERRGRLMAVREGLPGAQISTIHSFCASILREHPVEAEVDPNFTVLEEVERTLLIREVIEETLAHIADRDLEDPVRRQLSNLLEDWDRRYLSGLLGAMMGKKRLARAWLGRYGKMSEEEILGQWASFLMDTQRPVLESLLSDDRLISMLRELPALSPAQRAGSDSGEKIIAQIRDEVASLRDDISPKEACLIFQHLASVLTSGGKPLKGTRTGSKSNWDPEDLARLRSLLPEVSARLADVYPVLSKSMGGQDRRAASILRSLAEVFEQVYVRYEEKTGFGARLDFDELQEKMVDLLNRDGGAVGRRLAQRFRYVMVDEFQDTDPLQWEIVRPLVSSDGGVDQDKLFIVGDPKQSIYAFRDADVTVFEEVKKVISRANRHYRKDEIDFLGDGGSTLEATLEERHGSVVMGENFRSLPVPVDFVNFLFQQFMHPVAGEPFQVSYDPLICTRGDRDVAGSVTLLLAQQKDGEEELEAVHEEAELLARQIRRILDARSLSVYRREAGEEILTPACAQDIAILLRRRRYLSVYENALRAWRVPFYVVGGLGFYQRQEIYDLANLLRFLTNRQDSVTLIGLLRSPYFGFSDAGLLELSTRSGSTLWEKLIDAVHRDLLSPPDRDAARYACAYLDRWWELKDRVPLAELVRTIMEDTGAWGFLTMGERGEQTAANVEKFLSLARSFESGGFKALSDFVEHLDFLIEQEEKEGEAQLQLESGDAVRILTVHAAKGLEFPVVFVPDLGGGFKFGGDARVSIDRDYGVGISAPDPEEDYRVKPTLVRSLIHDLNKRKTLAEEKRLFYVAATRARDHLFLLGRFGSKDLKRTGSFDEATDRLRWLWVGLGLKEEDLERGEKTFRIEDREHRLQIITDPRQIEAARSVEEDEDRAYVEVMGRVGQGEEGQQPIQGLPEASMRALSPVEDRTEFLRLSATRLMTYQECPKKYFYQYEAGMPEWELFQPIGTKGTEGERSRALRFGDLAHRLLEEVTVDPSVDAEECADRLLLDFSVAEGERKVFRADLLRILRRFKTSTFGQKLSACRRSKAEMPFMLKVKGGILTGQIDKLYLDDDGLWKIADYKTNRIQPAEKVREAERYRLQMGIYLLCLGRMFPKQDRYETTIYFTEIDGTHTFLFSREDLEQFTRDIEELIQRISQRDFPSRSPVGHELLTQEETQDLCGRCGFYVNRICPASG